MSKVSADKKLELIRTIRMQNQYRENLIYSDEPSARHGEIYGLESMSYPVSQPSGISGENDKQGAGSGMLKGFRLRFAIAMGIFLAFVYCDIQNIKIGSVTSGDLYRIINENEMIPWLANLIK